MCQAIYKPKGIFLSRESLGNSWDRNRDGGGFAWHDKSGKLHVSKGFLEKKSFLDFFFRENLNRYETAVHTRLATHGSKTPENCHPFRFGGDDGALIHNGIISGLDTSGDHSDTRRFTESVIEPMAGLDADFLTREHNLYLIAQVIGWSKLVILWRGKAHIVNERAGAWERGAWFSNDSHKRPVHNFDHWKMVTGYDDDYMPPTRYTEQSKRLFALSAGRDIYRESVKSQRRVGK